MQAFWRTWPGDMPGGDMPGPAREELCPVPLGEMRAFLKDKRQHAWVWDSLEGHWQEVHRLRPGMVVLLRDTAGGYAPHSGWDSAATARVAPVIPAAPAPVPTGLDSDTHSHAAWQSLQEHGERTLSALQALLSNLDGPVPPDCLPALLSAARRHDWGKAHAVFQKACQAQDTGEVWAKAPQMRAYARRGFRHELASALALLHTGHDDLVVYLAAAHHGKIRLSLRALPNEQAPAGVRRFARGIHEGDSLPPVDGMPGVTLSLACIELGFSEQGASWADRMSALLEHWGPFRLAFWEALLRLADWRASAEDRHHA